MICIWIPEIVIVFLHLWNVSGCVGLYTAIYSDADSLIVWSVMFLRHHMVKTKKSTYTQFYKV